MPSSPQRSAMNSKAACPRLYTTRPLAKPPYLWNSLIDGTVSDTATSRTCMMSSGRHTPAR